MLFIPFFFLVFATVGLVTYVAYPLITNQITIVNQKRQEKLAVNMEHLLPRQEAKKMSRMFILAPILFGTGFLLLFPPEFRVIGLVLGVVAGFVWPSFYIKLRTRKTQDKFNDQLIDALMIMSSCFRGGLSLIQAFESVVEEMPDPICKEFGTVLGENKMGVSLEDALYHLYNRMPSPALQQMITAILLARETGGNLPVIFSRIVTNIREAKKIQQNLDTLTVQGKIQGIVMSFLPIGFGMVVYNANRKLFEHMLVSKIGKMMLVYAVISEIIGAFMIWKICTFKDY